MTGRNRTALCTFSPPVTRASSLKQSLRIDWAGGSCELLFSPVMLFMVECSLVMDVSLAAVLLSKRVLNKIFIGLLFVHSPPTKQIIRIQVHFTLSQSRIISLNFYLLIGLWPSATNAHAPTSAWRESEAKMGATTPKVESHFDNVRV